jgi:hypothetical protein
MSYGRSSRDQRRRRKRAHHYQTVKQTRRPYEVKGRPYEVKARNCRAVDNLCGECGNATQAANHLGPGGQTLCSGCKNLLILRLKNDAIWRSKPLCKECGDVDMELLKVQPLEHGFFPKGIAYWSCRGCQAIAQSFYLSLEMTATQPLPEKGRR